MILYELKQPKNSGTVPLRLDSKTGALLVSGALKKGRLAVFVEASDQVNKIFSLFLLPKCKYLLSLI